METWKTFISSTRTDLEQHRQAVCQILRDYGQVPIAMETFGAWPSNAEVVTKGCVADCDLFIGIYAFRYGTTPDEDGPSFTEQEYDEARLLGKRCLCYMADDSLRPSVSDESTKKLLRLNQFKGAIDRDLVRGLFSSPEDLAKGVARDLARIFVERRPLGYARLDVWRRWLRVEQARGMALRHDELDDHLEHVPSGLNGPWEKLVADRSWIEKTQSYIKWLREEASRTPRREPEIEGFLTAAAQIKLGCPYPEIAATLKSVVQDGICALGHLAERLAREALATDGEDRKERLKRVKWLQGNALNLARDLEAPRYRRCLCVLGSLGSGRTHFVAAHLAASDQLTPDARPYLLLPLSRQTGTSLLADRVLSAVRVATGLMWRDLAEFDAFLGEFAINRPAGEPTGRGLRLVVVIDDLHRGLSSSSLQDDLETLRTMVVDGTRYECLHWLILMQDVAYPLVAGRAQRQFWVEYAGSEVEQPQCSVDHGPPCIGPWWVLDELNRRSDLGRELIRSVLRARDEDASLALDAAGEHQHASERLSQPFLAWVLLDLHTTGKFSLDTLVDLNFVEFISAFWENRLDRMDCSPLDPNEVRLGTALVANCLESGTLRQRETALLDAVTLRAKDVSELVDRGRAASALRVLERASLLSIVQVPEPSLADAPVTHVEPRFETFWAWQLAKQLVASGKFPPSDGAGGRGPLEAWATTMVAPALREATLSFLLLLLDAKTETGSSPDGLRRNLLCATVESRRLPNAAAWLIGTRASLATQQILAERAQIIVARPAQTRCWDPHVLFSFLSFVGQADPHVLAASERFACWQPLYVEIGAADLDEYLLFLARRILDDVRSPADLKICWHRLAGCESMNVTEELARAAVSRLARIFERDRGEKAAEGATRWIMRYLEKCCTADSERSVRGGRGERYYVWHWLVTEFCRWLIRSYGLKAAEILDYCHWYTDARGTMGRVQRFAMQREANLAFGTWYRHDAGYADKNAYFGMVEQLVGKEEPHLRSRAYFLIRHTAPAKCGGTVEVDSRFGPLLRELATDPRLANDIARFPTFVPPI